MRTGTLQFSCLWLGLLGVGCALEPEALTSPLGATSRGQRAQPREARAFISGDQLTLEGGAVGTSEAVLASGSKLTVDINHFMSEAEDGTLSLESEFPAHCRGVAADGRSDFAVTAYARVNGHTTTYSLLDPRYFGTRSEGTAPFTLEVPTPTDRLGLELWFTGGPIAGPVDASCTTRVYRLPIIDVSSIPVITFEGDGRAFVDEVGGRGLVAGTFALLHYEQERLSALSPRCDFITGYAGDAAWDIRAQLQVDGRDLDSPSVAFDESWSRRAMHDILIELPEHSHELTVWFVVWGRDYYHSGPECTAYDSNYGRNFTFPIADF